MKPKVGYDEIFRELDEQLQRTLLTELPENLAIAFVGLQAEDAPRQCGRVVSGMQTAGVSMILRGLPRSAAVQVLSWMVLDHAGDDLAALLPHELDLVAHLLAGIAAEPDDGRPCGGPNRTVALLHQDALEARRTELLGALPASAGTVMLLSCLPAQELATALLHQPEDRCRYLLDRLAARHPTTLRDVLRHLGAKSSSPLLQLLDPRAADKLLNLLSRPEVIDHLSPLPGQRIAELLRSMPLADAAALLVELPVTRAAAALANLDGGYLARHLLDVTPSRCLALLQELGTALKPDDRDPRPVALATMSAHRFAATLVTALERHGEPMRGRMEQVPAAEPLDGSRVEAVHVVAGAAIRAIHRIFRHQFGTGPRTSLRTEWTDLGLLWSIVRRSASPNITGASRGPTQTEGALAVTRFALTNRHVALPALSACSSRSDCWRSW
ncbi:hypothetical protein O3597_16670 [Verrucosispora sp. WMMA2044]|uniref:magnesium transporter MgtE N-terminal domain-containing protein n=1 Tax=Verrucosispora sp. WMMA2044 TaxID=3016419 RepID=UPI00248C82BC|nr:hypothetical protein [Verrucosispora sp. WMMA2044]WBB46818.1 hypothetical protein O3597_16670 [Verrucosispora sp. WMMA2044]